VGPHEYFGLNECGEASMAREYTVTCLSNGSKVYFISKEDFTTRINNAVSKQLID
jgi:hypothetical protein